MTYRIHFVLVALLLAACAPALPPAELTETWTNDVMAYTFSYPADMTVSQSDDGACVYVRKQGDGPQPLLTVVFGSACPLHTDFPIGKQSNESVTVAALGATITTDYCWTAYGTAEDRTDMDVITDDMHHKDCGFMLERDGVRYDWLYEIATKYGSSVSVSDMEHLSATARAIIGSFAPAK